MFSLRTRDHVVQDSADKVLNEADVGRLVMVADDSVGTCSINPVQLVILTQIRGSELEDEIAEVQLHNLQSFEKIDESCL
jgi:hypothetical protein